jgi:hypothetical protein
MTTIELNTTDDLNGLKLFNSKMKEKADELFNRDIIFYQELKNEIIELYNKNILDKQIKFLKYIDSYDLSIEEVILILPCLFTHAITFLIIKNILEELIKYRNKMTHKIDMAYIQDKLNVSMDIINDNKIMSELPKPKIKKLKKLKTLKFKM